MYLSLAFPVLAVNPEKQGDAYIVPILSCLRLLHSVEAKKEGS